MSRHDRYKIHGRGTHGLSSRRRGKIRAQLLIEQNGKCKKCKRKMIPAPAEGGACEPRTVTIDHIIPICEGGTNDPENLCLLCYECNQKKGKKEAKRANRRRKIELTRS